MSFFRSTDLSSERVATILQNLPPTAMEKAIEVKVTWAVHPDLFTRSLFPEVTIKFGEPHA